MPGDTLSWANYARASTTPDQFYNVSLLPYQACSGQGMCLNKVLSPVVITNASNLGWQFALTFLQVGVFHFFVIPLNSNLYYETILNFTGSFLFGISRSFSCFVHSHLFFFRASTERHGPVFANMLISVGGAQKITVDLSSTATATQLYNISIGDSALFVNQAAAATSINATTTTYQGTSYSTCATCYWPWPSVPAGGNFTFTFPSLGTWAVRDSANSITTIFIVGYPQRAQAISFVPSPTSAPSTSATTAPKPSGTTFTFDSASTLGISLVLFSLF